MEETLIRNDGNELRKGRPSEARGLQERKDRPFYRIGADGTERVRQKRGICCPVPNRQQQVDQAAGTVRDFQGGKFGPGGRIGTCVPKRFGRSAGVVETCRTTSSERSRPPGLCGA